MPDEGTRFADARQEAIERLLRPIYEAAQRDVVKRLDEHSKRLYAADKVKRMQLASGKITQEQYRTWLSRQMFVEKVWKDQISGITDTLLTANIQANRIVEGERRAVFGENANYQAYQIEKDTNGAVSFTLYDSAAVTRLIREQPNLLPPRVVDGEKDKAWNREKISGVIARGIIAGSSIPTIARNIGKETGTGNETAMLRYARTAMTGAQNSGRIEVMHEAEEMGVQVQKVWLATLDERTRPAHQELDGQTVDVNESFDSILGPIDYPGDPSADPANTWNCRCSLTYNYKEYPKHNSTRRDQESGEEIEDMTYVEWWNHKHPDKPRPGTSRKSGG